MPEDQNTQTTAADAAAATTPAAATPPKTETAPDKSGQTGVTFTQADIDRIIGERLQRAEASATEKLLKALGVDSVEVLKTTLDAQRQADEAAKTELQKAQDKLAAAEKKAAEAETRAQAIEAQRLTDQRDGKILAALREARTSKPDSVLTLLKADEAEAVSAVMAEGKVDEVKLKALVDAAKKKYAELFTGSGPGIPSNNGGRVPDAREGLKTAQDAHFKRARRSV